jgi:hypothetical protein
VVAIFDKQALTHQDFPLTIYAMLSLTEAYIAQAIFQSQTLQCLMAIVGG